MSKRDIMIRGVKDWGCRATTAKNAAAIMIKEIHQFCDDARKSMGEDKFNHIERVRRGAMPKNID